MQFLHLFTVQNQLHVAAKKSGHQAYNKNKNKKYSQLHGV
jgi:hypothetical protein